MRFMVPSQKDTLAPVQFAMRGEWILHNLLKNGPDLSPGQSYRVKPTVYFWTLFLHDERDRGGVRLAAASAGDGDGVRSDGGLRANDDRHG